MIPRLLFRESWEGVGSKDEDAKLIIGRLASKEDRDRLVSGVLRALSEGKLLVVAMPIVTVPRGGGERHGRSVDLIVAMIIDTIVNEMLERVVGQLFLVQSFVPP
jgi:hypothetical protein